MPWRGAPSIAADAGATIERVVARTEARLATTDVGSGTLRFEDLVPPDANDAAHAVRELRHAVAWVDDWACDKRALVASALFNQRLGLPSGTEQALRSAIAFVRPAPYSVNWNYHAAGPAFIDEASGELRIVDFLLDPDNGVIDAATLARAVGRTAADIELVHPLAHVVTRQRVEAGYLYTAAADLTRSIGIERERRAFAAGLPLPSREAALA